MSIKILGSSLPWGYKDILLYCMLLLYNSGLSLPSDWGKGEELDAGSSELAGR